MIKIAVLTIDFLSWEFAECRGTNDIYPDADEDPLFKSGYLHDVYFRADSAYTGRYSVPVLWDKQENTIVNSESLKIMSWLPSAFSKIEAKKIPHPRLNLLPEHLKQEIEDVKTWLTRDFNSGVYRAGFATT